MFLLWLPSLAGLVILRGSRLNLIPIYAFTNRLCCVILVHRLTKETSVNVKSNLTQ